MNVIKRIKFDIESLNTERGCDERMSSWPVVYLLSDQKRIYIGETSSAINRLKQHLRTPDKQKLDIARIIIYDRFNSSVCYDLESTLIKWFAGDGHFTLLNRNDGVRSVNYPDRHAFQPIFRDIFDRLKEQGLFDQSIHEIENGDLFKLSPFKSLNMDQEEAVGRLLNQLIEDIKRGEESSFVVKGSPGTGKTIIATFLIKLLRDLGSDWNVNLDVNAYEHERKGSFDIYFTDEVQTLLKDFRIGFVIPQQSLRKSIKRVFEKTTGLESIKIMSPFDVGVDHNRFDLLIVDEAHRLNLRANQPSGMLNKKFTEINQRLFGADDLQYTQLDWMYAQSKHQVFLLDGDQSVRPSDLSAETIFDLSLSAQAQARYFELQTQMRVCAGNDYIQWVRDLLSGCSHNLIGLDSYELKLFDDFNEMYQLVKERDREFGLSRVLAGYAWEWRSKGKFPSPEERPYDIELDGHLIRWNSTDKDWVNSPNSLSEMGSIHTIQGYDLNYAGVVIGPDLYKDPQSGQILFNRSCYFDKKGVENNLRLNIQYTDGDILIYIRNIYTVLLTRGIRGTYIYVVDPCLRQHIKDAIALIN